MPKATRGVLVECDPSIKAIIEKIDEANHDFILEDLGEERVLVKETKLEELKIKLDQVLKDSQSIGDSRGPDGDSD